MGNKIILSEEYFQKTLKEFGKKLVGETMPHFETGNTDIESIKKSVKNSIWQVCRDVEIQFKAFNYGVKFVAPKTKK